jgi:hypothetical protein
MDRLFAAIETKTEEAVETEKQPETETIVEAPRSDDLTVSVAQPQTTQYLSSLENITVADYKRQEEEKQLKEFEKEKEELIQKQYEPEAKPKQEESQNIIEKPNYDFISEEKNVVKLSKKQQKKSTPVRKKLNLFLSIALAVCAVVCVTNIVVIDNMSANLTEIETEFYDINLPKYLKNIANLDTTKKGMDFIETYPEDSYDAGEVGEKSNWFDKICNFFAGLFGG